MVLHLSEQGAGTRVVMERGRRRRTRQAGAPPLRAPGIVWRNRESLRRLAFLAERGAVTTYDGIVIGSGPNGLVAANHLVDAGWSVLVLEGQPDLGGAVRSANDVHPDFVHDTFSAFYPLAAASPTLRSFHLEDHGLVWRHAPAVLGHPFPDGSWALLDRDREVTASASRSQHAGDGDAWLELCDQWDVIGDQLIQGLLTPFPPVRATLGGLVKLPAGRRAAVRPRPADADHEPRPGAVRRRGSADRCWPATPATPTSRSTPAARG